MIQNIEVQNSFLNFVSLSPSFLKKVLIKRKRVSGKNRTRGKIGKEEERMKIVPVFSCF